MTGSMQEELPNIQKLSLKNSPKLDHRSTAEIELDRIERKLRTIQQSLEILTGVCTTLPDPEPAPEADSGEDDMGDGDEGTFCSDQSRRSVVHESSQTAKWKMAIWK